MEQFENFGAADVQNGRLAEMFRRAGIDDVQNYVEEVRQTPLEATSKRSHGKAVMNNAKQIYQFCKSLDKNGDGKITVEDVEIILKEMGLGFVSKHLARAIFNIVDTNHNGQLEFRDLLALTTLLKQLTSSSSVK